jgi:hypothetical protein
VAVTQRQIRLHSLDITVGIPRLDVVAEGVGRASAPAADRQDMARRWQVGRAGSKPWQWWTSSESGPAHV